MDKCPNCGCPTGCHTVGVAALWQPEIDGIHFDCMTIAWEDGQVDVGMDCLRRQLAAANERAGRLEAQISGCSDYDPGLINDYGGGNVDWWMDYVRGEVNRANEFWRYQIDRILGGA